MADGQPFIGSEALASGLVNRHELRRYHRAVMPNVYLDKRAEPSLRDRICAAWLWSRRQGVVSGLAASNLHGSRWVDDDIPVELIYRNARAPQGVITRDDLLLEEEIRRLNGLPVTTPERTAFDLGRRDRIGRAVERLDALARATDFKAPTSRSWRAGTATRGVCASSRLRSTSLMLVPGHRGNQRCGSC